VASHTLKLTVGGRLQRAIDAIVRRAALTEANVTCTAAGAVIDAVYCQRPFAANADKVGLARAV